MKKVGKSVDHGYRIGPQGKVVSGRLTDLHGRLASIFAAIAREPYGCSTVLYL